MQKKEKLTFPRYYKTEDLTGQEQIYLESPSFHIYIRAINYNVAMDYAYYSGPLKKMNVEDIKRRFQPSTEEEFKKLLDKVIIYFSELREVAPKVLREPKPSILKSA